MSTSPLDILCKVAADAESVQQLPPLRTTRPETLPRLPPIAAPPFRLSSSAPTHPGFLSNPSLPTEPPPNYHNGYYIGDSTLTNQTTTVQPLSVSYPHTILNPPQPQHPLPRNMSAPSLGEHGQYVHVPHQTVILDEGYRISRTPSQNIPVPARMSSVMAPQGMSPPLYGSPPSTGMTRIRSPSYGSGPLKSVSGRASKSSGRRDSYTRFTAEEEAMLMEGVRVYGVGNWKKILNSYRFHWKRTAVDLKDKYRNMTRAKLRRMNASSQSDLSSVGSDDGRGVQGMSPLQSELLSKTVGLGISPVSTANNTPAGSMEERDRIMRR